MEDQQPPPPPPPPPPAQGEEAAAAAAAPAPVRRWTCEACGCNTNTSENTSCSICGTSNSGPSLLRRASNARNSASWFARGVLGRGVGGGAGRAGSSGILNDDLGIGSLEDEAADLWESVVDDVEMAGGSSSNNNISGYHSHAEAAAAAAASASSMEAFAMEVSGMASAARRSMETRRQQREQSAAIMETGRQRFLDAARAFSQASREIQRDNHSLVAAAAAAARGVSQPTAASPYSSAASPPAVLVPPAELLELATRNASQYQPRWNNPSNMAGAGGRSVRGTSSRSSISSSTGTGIQVSEGEGQNLAQLLPSAGGGGEGRAVRAEEPFPRPERETPAAALFFARSPSSSSSSASSSSPISSPTAAGAGAASIVGAAAAAVVGAPVSSPTRTSSGGAGTDEKGRRRVFGFRVAFDHPTVEDGESMGGCYLVGVTTSSFTAYGEQSALSQSPFFWGIEDGGNKYEGSRYHHHHPTSSAVAAASQDGRIASGAITNRRLSASYAMDLESSAHDVPFNDANVLFGSKDVVTVVCDLDNRTLTFWRNETLLGTLVSNLPRTTGAAGNQLFPVAVPFNCGVTVAITGLDGDPLPILRSFATNWRKAQQDKEDAIRQALEQQRALLITPSANIECAADDTDESTRVVPRIMTPQLLDVLKQIFALYGTTTHQGGNRNSSSSNDDDECMKLDDDASSQDQDMTLDQCAATRLFYRCGLNLKAATPSDATARVTFQDFLTMVDKVLLEDEQNMRLQATKKPPPPTMGLGGRSNRDVQKGDKVELVEGYEKFGDASGGPLRPGDRGTVVELQNGPSGERRSIRVLYSGRRWWYQPQAVLSERSGLIESPGVWFLRGLLRAHGYNHATLQPLAEKPLRLSDCQVGDLVIPASMAGDADKCASCYGRIAVDTGAPPSLTSTSSVAAPSSSSATVSVEFVGSAFAEAVKLQPISSINSSVLETRRVLVQHLAWAPPSLYGCVAAEEAYQKPESCEKVRDDEGMNLDEEEVAEGNDEEVDPDDECLAPESVSISEKVQSDITGVARLDGHAIESISKECKKNPESLASVFSSGLPEALLSATEVAERQMNSLEPREDLSERISAIGSLTMFIADQLFSDKPHSCSRPQADSAASESQESNSPAPEQAASSAGSLINRSSAARSIINAGRRQSTVRDAIARREEERGRAAQGLVASLQQRRSMLLSLMSRARRANVNALEELDASGSGALARELSQIASPADFMGGDYPNAMDGSWDEVAALAGNYPGGMSYGADDGMPELVGRDGSSRRSERSSSDSPEPSATYLDSILRNGTTLALTNSSKSKPTSSSQFVFFQQLIGTGMMTNNVKWIKGSIESLVKKTSQRSHSMFRNAVDEEGTPLLHLCISFGCSPDIVNYLLGCGAPVTVADVKKAIETDQPKVLTLLLRHSSLPDDIDPSQCSVEVIAVLARAKRRQDQLDKKMRETAGSFMVQMLRRLLSLGLLSRKHRSPILDNVSRSISGILVGNVLLRALQKTQKVVPGNADDDPDSQEDTSSGRFTVDENFSAYSARGLFGSLPRSILSEAFLIDVDRATTLLLLVEDYLCSKDMSDAAAGLTALASILSHFPALCTSSEMSRFGMIELVALHDALASNRCAEILSRQLKSDLQLDSAGTEPSTQAVPATTTTSCVLCPKKHTAVLHITRHSSFRCDLCGCGVERGRPMHGCRECDWDGCEECTDKAESGLVKCAAIREVASDCRKLLTGEVKTGEDDERSLEVARKLSSQVSASEMESMSMRLLQQDVEAIRDLARMLRTPGRVSIHQFLTSVLPALHAACVARSSESGGAIVATGSGHRNKKAKVVGSHYRDLDEVCTQTPEHRLSFCRELVRAMILEFEEISPARVNDADRLRGSSAISDHESDGGEDGDEDGQNDDSPNVSEREIAYFAESSELLRRLMQILSLYENVTIGPTLYEKKSPPGGDLHALTKPLEIHLKSSSFEEALPSPFSLVVHAEPLVPVADLQLHVLRCCSSFDPSYASFCESLAYEKAIIVERSARDKNGRWEFAQVTDYDDVSGAHTVRYASRFKRGQDCGILQFNEGTDVSSMFAFAGREAHLCLVVREYFVLRRLSSGKAKSSSPARAARASTSTPKLPSDGTPGAGTRVERSHPDGKTWESCTMLPSSGENRDSGFTLVSDDGIVYYGLGSGSIRISGIPVDVNADDDPSARRARRRRDAGDALNRAFPFLARQRSDSRESEDPPRTIGALTRSWSALSLADKLKPLELFPIKETKPHRGQNPEHDVLALKCKLDDVELQLIATQLESPPELIVRFSLHEKLPGVEMSDSGSTTLVRALHKLHARKHGGSELQLLGTHRLYFSISSATSPSKATLETIKSLRQAASPGPPDLALTDTTTMTAEEGFGWTRNSESRSRKLSSRSLGSEEEEGSFGLCEGLDEICVQCMEVVSVLSEFAGDSCTPRDRDRKCSVFSNGTLSRKLIDNLNDPISVVAGALPDWVITAPVFAPRVFSYESRRTLLERVAFGVSRSILKQQENKVNVGRLRQRMASLRGRAVELVGEAFSGGAEDPTALQLQADELYGMEEALASRVRAAFRAVKWKEHSLEVAKAAVHRETLLLDADAIMEKYAADEALNRRRLEIRFDGESGFDAASGDEAGVTRGFYADVAELLLSSDTVAGVYCSNNCTEVAAAASLSKAQPMDVDESQNESPKLPLWIPDMDSSGQVVIPTPRSDPRSGLGVFPRPLPRYHPQIQDVLEKFRFMGRLFAAAMRDGFMFPLPLSSAFLKLVQNGGTTDVATFDTLLTTNDLPRSGFLGGEIHAAEAHICRALDKLDAADPPLSRHELQRRYDEIANDKNFARSALGKSYDCSFEDYFQDRTFVDPLDPAQDENAAPLCPKGHKKSVTVYNVREWVALAKKFFLHDGVIGQALAFRSGVEDFFPADYLRLFTAEELQRDVCGVGDNVENWDESAVRKIFKLDGGKGAAEALVAVAAIGGEGGAALSRRFGPSSPTIGFLVKALLEGSPKQRRQFLSFVTSVPIVTPGRIEVVPIVSPSGEFLPMRDPGCLPRANTCARRLYLPKFDDYAAFSQVLWAVVREESKFKGFYEWRGG